MARVIQQSLGTSVAAHARMAAVMALVFLFVVASVGLMLKISVGLGFATIFAMTCFSALAIGVFVFAFVQVRGWENE
ncbi:MAG: hypothetical protein JO257_16005 [Deltaproteobacteria bacterium]|nr:hypothetical protein [Deltaproteobacteria bacterium]